MEESSQHTNTSYAETHYLLFGQDPDLVYDLLNCEETAAYLEKLGFSDNALTRAREGKIQTKNYGGYQDSDAHYCDFCGCLLVGDEFEVLKDGRERCVECSNTVVRQFEDFESLFSQTRDGLCLKYDIELPSPIKVKVVSQEKMAKMQGSKFVPTKYFDPRAVGLAIDKHGSYSMYFENGTPKIALIATAAHELTHIWQYSHWNMEAMEAKYGKAYLAVVEGMAKWCEIQYLYLLNEGDYADRSLANETSRDDVYGYGLRMYLNQYPLSKDILLHGTTPFEKLDDPINL